MNPRIGNAGAGEVSPRRADIRVNIRKALRYHAAVCS
jgi:hypothetical protein